MATSKPKTTEDAPEEQAPAEVSEARKRFLAGELSWNEYCEAENAEQ